jgi:8-oxo-dGTP pyrophosphatase MutT (NUDIX family)
VAAEEATPREAARVLVFDGSDRLLLLRGHDPAMPERSWWFTPGGGLHEGETTREAAAREAAEETGFVLEPRELIGPVWERTAVFDFMERPYVQHEEFFVARVGADSPREEAAWTAIERDTLEAIAWLSVEEIVGAEIEVFPTVLGHALQTVLPWDGVLRHLGTEDA